MNNFVFLICACAAGLNNNNNYNDGGSNLRSSWCRPMLGWMDDVKVVLGIKWMTMQVI